MRINTNKKIQTKNHQNLSNGQNLIFSDEMNGVFAPAVLSCDHLSIVFPYGKFFIAFFGSFLHVVARVFLQSNEKKFLNEIFQLDKVKILESLAAYSK